MEPDVSFGIYLITIKAIEKIAEHRTGIIILNQKEKAKLFRLRCSMLSIERVKEAYAVF